MDLSFIFIGSTHSFLDDFSKQKEIISIINPEFVLSEELEDLKLERADQFKEILEKKFISDMTSFGEVEKLIKLCFEKKIKLIGIDFHNFGFDENLQRKIKNQKELTKEEEEKLNKLVEKREKYHLSKILEYKSKTKLPIIIILGCWHLRKDSLLRKRLKNYKIIAPIDGSGEILLEPNNKDIKYGEIISNEQ
ncbi:MAG: hypothetical protein AABX12_00540 [Nanoarchaeota archaeon]